MSQVKKRNVVLIFVMLLISLFAVGCKKETPVDDISFALQDNNQIVLFVGERLDMGGFVEIKPTYATNKKYSLISLDENVIKIQGGSIVAVNEGSAQVRVISESNPEKEDLMSVIVKKTKEQLGIPTGLNYDETNHTFNFEKVPYATSYTLKLNGETIELGNSNSFKLRSPDDLNKMLVVQLRANAPTYTKALLDSNYSAEKKFYQVGSVQNVVVDGGVLRFEKPNLSVSKILLNGLELVNLETTSLDLRELDSNFSGMVGNLQIETSVKESDKVSGVTYGSSTYVLSNVKIASNPTLRVNQSVISWDYDPFASAYQIKVGEIINEKVNTNFYDLSNLDLQALNVYDVKVESIVEGTQNTGKVKFDANNIVKVSKLANVNITTRDNNIEWSETESAETYSVVLEDSNDVLYNASMTTTQFDMSSYDVEDYVIKIKAVGGAEPKGGVYYIPSDEIPFEFDKKESLGVYISDYKLHITNLDGDKFNLQFDDGTIISSLTNQTSSEIDLKGYNFEETDHILYITRLSDDDSVQSEVASCSFKQLKSLAEIKIEDYVVSISNLNDYIGGNVTILVKSSGVPKGIKTFKVVENMSQEASTLILNSTDITKERLEAGEYDVEVKLSGDGAATFGNSSLNTTFVVLDAPTLTIDTSDETPKLKFESVYSTDKYRVIINGTETKEVLANEMEISVAEGEPQAYKVAAVGDGSSTLTSIESTSNGVYRILSSKLKFDSSTNKLLKEDREELTNIIGSNPFKLMKNGTEMPYDFNNPTELSLTEDTSFELHTHSIPEKGGVIYLNSSYVLNLTKIENQTTIELDGDNNLIITPDSASAGHDSLKYLELVIQTIDDTFTFMPKSGAEETILTNGTIELPYSYSNGVYAITIMNNYSDPKIPGLINADKTTNEFKVNVRYHNISTGDDTFINSEYLEEDQSLTLIKIANQTTIEIDKDNNLYLTPEENSVGHDSFKHLELIIETTNDSYVFVPKAGAEETILTNELIELPYSYSEGVYTIYLVDDYSRSRISGIVNKTFKINVKYCSTEDDTFVDSSYLFTNEELEESEDFSLIKIENIDSCVIESQYQKQLIITAPESHHKEFGLVVNIAGLEFRSNDSHKLIVIGGGIELTYDYDEYNKKYIIDLLTDDYLSLIDALNTPNSSFAVAVKFMRNLNAQASDCDSEEISHTFNVLDGASLTRNGQNLIITHPANASTYTFENYALIINDSSTLVKFPESYVPVKEGEDAFEFDISFVYSNDGIDDEVNSVRVVTFDHSTSSVAVKSDEILVKKAPNLTIETTKDNNSDTNNSVMIHFETIENKYVNDINSKYILLLSNGTDTKALTADAQNKTGVISFNLDEANIEGDRITIKAYVQTGLVIEGNINVFNSNDSNELEIIRISNVSNIRVDDGDLKFDEVSDAVGYEVYKFANDTYYKLHTGLIDGTTFDLNGYYGENNNQIDIGQTTLVVKTISAEEISDKKQTNSLYSDPINVYRFETPGISVVKDESVDAGKIKIKFPWDMAAVANPTQISKINPIITNNGDNKYLTLENSEDGSAQFNINLYTQEISLICEPYLFLNYNGINELAKETLNFQLKFDELNKGTNDNPVWCLDSAEVGIPLFGLFAPSSVKKITDNDGKVQKIEWTPSSYNKISGTPASSIGYVIKIEHIVDGEPKTYYSSDSKLKYYDSSVGQYVSYDNLVNKTSAVFPAQYNGVDFIDGVFKVSIQAVPLINIGDNVLCRSVFSNEYTFEILRKPELSIYNGKVVWDGIDNAKQYSVKVYEKDNTTTSIPAFDIKDPDMDLKYSFDFTKNLSGITGMLRVEIQAVNNNNNYVNSLISDPIYVYRLSEVSNIKIDDGNLLFEASKYFTTAVIDFKFRSETITEYYDNSTLASNELNNLSYTDWKDVDVNAMNNNKGWFVHKFSEFLNIESDDDYTIDITLIGNSETGRAIASSYKTVNVSNMKVQKLNHNFTLITSDRGVAQYSSDFNQNMNYIFNGAAATSSIDFWNNTKIYKIKINETIIYAVDYNNVEAHRSSINDEDISFEDGDSHGHIKYRNGTDEIWFNIYRENKIDFNAIELKYYHIEQKFENGQVVFEQETPQAIKTITFIGDDVVNTINDFTINVSLMGGDHNTDGGNSFAYVNSNINGLDTFKRYNVVNLTTENGKLKFANAKIEGFVDSPIYKVTDLTTNKIYYLYHNLDGDATTLEETIKAKYDIGDDVLISIKDQDDLIFDISEKIDSGHHRLTIQTLAGIESGNYLLDSIESSDTNFYKLSDVAFSVSNGLIVFDQSYVTIGGVNKYYSDYEINIIYGEDEYVYSIGELSSGVKIDGGQHKVTYMLPNSVNAYSVNDKVTEDLSFGENVKFTIKIRAKSYADRVLRGTYKHSLETSKNSNVNSFEIKDGKLYWQVAMAEGMNPRSKVKLSYGTTEFAEKEVNGTYNDAGYYEFIYEIQDNFYDKINPTGAEEIIPGRDYNVSVYVVGNSSVLNGNLSNMSNKQRLSPVETISIDIDDDCKDSLIFSEVMGAEKYLIIVDETRLIEVEETLVSLQDLNLSRGDHNVQIRAIGGSSFFNSKLSSKITLTKLQEVSGDIILNGRIIKWNEVANATGYWVELTQEGSDKPTITTRVNENILEIDTSLSLSGYYKLSVKALGGGVYINSDISEFTITNETPAEVDSFSYNAELYRFEITPSADKTELDQIYISYTLQKYASVSSLEVEKEDGKEIAYKVEDLVEKLDGSIYYYPLKVVGIYTNISVFVRRNGAIDSASVSHNRTQETFTLFDCGAGVEGESYGIKTADQLFNIDLYKDANYVLAGSIDLSGKNIASRLSDKGAIITDEFRGILDGREFNVSGFGGEYENLTSFALFGSISGTIKNLHIGPTGDDAKITIVNTISSSVADIKFALLANSATGATIENITVVPTDIKIKSNSGTSVNNINIAALVNNIQNTTITNLKTELTAEINSIYVSNESYVGGAVAKATGNSTLSNSIVKLTATSTYKLTYVGGLVGYFAGVDNNTYNANINNVKVTINAENVSSSYFAGVVGYAQYVNITDCEVDGIIKHKGINTNCYIGGLVGSAKDANIINSGIGDSKLDMSGVVVKNSSGVYIGMLVGYIQSSLLTAYWSDYDTETGSNTLTTYKENTVQIGAYGQSGEGVKITITTSKVVK